MMELISYAKNVTTRVKNVLGLKLQTALPVLLYTGEFMIQIIKPAIVM